ncbi:MAG TPA: alpha/beta fold hydrolase [Longimicrobiales bacterium]|nr:alpha/beta fold hydrolase [Longimicrobiales bacterium]
MVLSPLHRRSPQGTGGRPTAGRRRLAVGFVAVPLGLFLAVALGPRARFEGTWVEPRLEPDLDAYLAAQEGSVPRLRPGEAKSIAWADSEAREPTPVSVVYLHGFSADRHEVEPLVSDLARDLHANAYYARLRGHGRDGSAMGEVSVPAWLEDVAEAVAIGGRIGERIVLVGTSTGGTLALWAAARPEAADRVAALVLISPNLGLRDPSARVLTWPWGGALARAIVGAERCFDPATPEQARHWTVCYPTRALLPMMALVEHVRSMDLRGVRAPALLIYSRADAVVDPQESERVLSGLGASGASTFLVEGSGDPASHVLAGSIMSPGTTEAVRRRILDFLAGSGIAPR